MIIIECFYICAFFKTHEDKYGKKQRDRSEFANIEPYVSVLFFWSMSNEIIITGDLIFVRLKIICAFICVIIIPLIYGSVSILLLDNRFLLFLYDPFLSIFFISLEIGDVIIWY